MRLRSSPPGLATAMPDGTHSSQSVPYRLAIRPWRKSHCSSIVARLDGPDCICHSPQMTDYRIEYLNAGKIVGHAVASGEPYLAKKVAALNMPDAADFVRIISGDSRAEVASARYNSAGKLDWDQ